MLFLWIGLCAVGLAVLVISVTCLVCFFQVFYAPPRHPLGADEFEIPDGDIYEAFREDMIAWTKMIRSFPYEDVSVTSFDGLILRGKFFEYEKGAPIELMFHGYKGNAERDLNGGVERCFALGHSALLIDHRASGASDGRVITFGILERRDCLRWVDFAAQRYGPDCKLILTGISMGAATVMMAASEPLPPQVKYVLADCGYTSPQEIIRKVMRDMRLPDTLLYPFVKIGARIFGRFDLDEYSPLEAMKKVTLPIVLAHGDTDDFVPYGMSVRLYEVCSSEHKKLITVPHAGHGLAFPVGRESYVAALAEFKRECGFDF